MSDNAQTNVDQVERKVIALKNKLNRENVFTIVVGVLLLGVVAFYFIWGYSEIKSVLTPGHIVSLASSELDKNLPSLRSTITAELDKNAPIWAEQLSEQAVASAPAIREQIEEVSMTRVDEAVERVVNLSAAEFSTFLDDNRTEIARAIEELSSNDQVSDESLDSFQQALDEQLSTDIKDQAGQVLRTLEEIKTKMAYLRSGQNLAEIEEMERRLIMILRRMHLRESGA